jgi:hypothetical protein
VVEPTVTRPIQKAVGKADGRHVAALLKGALADAQQKMAAEGALLTDRFSGEREGSELPVLAPVSSVVSPVSPPIVSTVHAVCRDHGGAGNGCGLGNRGTHHASASSSCCS